MNQLKRFVLWKDEIEGIRITVWAEIRDGSLTVSGQDLGKRLEDLFGEGEYEYFYSFDRENTARLIALLTDGGPDLKGELIQRFSGNEGCARLRQFCEENDLTYSFYSC